MLSESQLSAVVYYTYMLQAAMAYEVTFCLLFLTVVRSSGFQPKQIIYLDEGNRTLSLDPSCWENGPGVPI